MPKGNELLRFRDVKPLAKSIRDAVSKENPTNWSDQKSLHIPKPECCIINISGVSAMPTSKIQDLHGIMEFWDLAGNYFKKNVILNAQGNSSMGFIKKNYAVDICNDEWIGDDTFSLKIGDWVPMDSFHVKAYYTDYFRGVAVVSYQLMDEIVRTRGIAYDRPWKKALINQDEIRTVSESFGGIEEDTLKLDTGARNFPDGIPCITYLNDVFYGIFSFQIKKHRDNMHQEKKVNEHIHLDGSLYTSYFWKETLVASDWTQWEVRNPKSLITMDGEDYDGDSNCNELIDSTSEYYDSSNKKHKNTAKVKKYIQNFSACISKLETERAEHWSGQHSDPTTEDYAERKAYMREQIEYYFDPDNLIDYLILSDVVKNSDGFGKNWQWCTYDGIKWYVNLYDVDMSFGGHFQGNQITAPLTGHISTTRSTFAGWIIEFYLDELNARYAELRDAGIIDADHIIKLLDTWTKAIGEDNYELEWDKWPDAPCIGESVVNTDYWELQLDDDGNPIKVDSNTYDMTKSYEVGDTCGYGITSAMGYYSFECVTAHQHINSTPVINGEVNTEYWEQQYNEDETPITATDTTYYNTYSYSVGAVVHYGGYVYKCIKYYAYINQTPIITFRHNDNIYRVKKWLDQEIANMDTVYKYTS